MENELTKYFQPEDELVKATIIGVAKCGTTSLWYYLSKHPEIFAHPEKELKYFYARHLTREEKETNMNGFPNSAQARTNYLGLFEAKMRDYVNQEQQSSVQRSEKKKVLLEATPGYLFNPLIPERMSRVLPEAKLLIVLRDPVARAYSEWQMRHFSQKKEGASSPPTTVSMSLFLEEVERDMKRIESATTPSEESLEFDWKAYLQECSDVDQPKGINEFQPLVGRGLYYHQLVNWLHYYPKENLHIISSDEMRAHPAEVLNQVCRFLGIDDHFYHDQQTFLHEEKNVGGTTFKSSLAAGLPSPPLCSATSSSTPLPPIHSTDTSPFPTSGAPSQRKEPIPAEFEEKMYSFFTPHNQLLYKLIGRDLHWMKKQK